MGRFSTPSSRGFESTAALYTRTLGWALRHRTVILGGALATIIVAVVISRPSSESSSRRKTGLFHHHRVCPEGSTLSYTDQYERRIEAILAHTKDVEGYFSIVGFGGRVNQGILFVRLTDWSKRKRQVKDVINEVQPQFFGVPGVFAFANNPPAFGGFSNPVQFVVQHPDFAVLTKAMDTLVTRARTIKGLINVDTDLRVNKPELAVTFDRNRAEDLGIPVRDVASAMQTLLGGHKSSTFTRDNKLYDVMVQLRPEERATPADMSGIYLRGNDGQLINLEQLANGQRKASVLNR